MDKGELAELSFALEASKRGYIISKPIDPKCKYDFVVDTGHKLSKVQVKSCSSLDKRGRYRVDIACGATVKRPYQEGEVDIFAIQLINEDTWFIIPREVLDNMKWVGLYSDKQFMYSRHKSNWSILNGR